MKPREWKALIERIAKTVRSEYGVLGGRARKNALSPRRRKEIASKAAKARWKKAKRLKRSKAA